MTVYNRGKVPIRLVYSTSDSTGCFARLPREPVPAGGLTVVPLLVTLGGVPRTTQVKIHTDMDSQPVLDVPIRPKPEGGTPHDHGSAVSAGPAPVLSPGTRPGNPE